MKRTVVTLLLLGISAIPMAAASKPSLTGTYVEARTAEVFTGACVMNSEAETMGKEAVLAWRVDHGTFEGVPVDGLAVVAAVAADKNLGIHEIGGEKAVSRTELFVDERASAAQRHALVAMVTALSNGALGTILDVTPTAIRFNETANAIDVSTTQVALTVHRHMTHDPGCGAQQWFHPLASVADATLGHTAKNAYTGAGLCAKWSDPDKRSSFFGKFSE